MACVLGSMGNYLAMQKVSGGLGEQPLTAGFALAVDTLPSCVTCYLPLTQNPGSAYCGLQAQGTLPTTSREWYPQSRRSHLGVSEN